MSARKPGRTPASTTTISHGTTPLPHHEHELAVRAIASHRAAKAAGDAHLADAALVVAQMALEAHLIALRARR